MGATQLSCTKCDPEEPVNLTRFQACYVCNIKNIKWNGKNKDWLAMHRRVSFSVELFSSKGFLPRNQHILAHNLWQANIAFCQNILIPHNMKY